MHLIYYSHSYRTADNDINEFFQELMLSENMTPSLDPPSDRLNSAKPERHLRSTDGMIAVLPYRDPEPSNYILYEIALCVRAQKPVLVFIEDVLPDNLLSDTLLVRRFSRNHYLREVRNHRHALQMLKTYIGTEPPPTYQPNSGQRSCLLIGESSLSRSQRDDIHNSIRSMKYSPITLPSGDNCLSYEKPYERIVAQSMLCVSFVDKLSPLEYYMLGATRASLTPAILLTQNPSYPYNPNVPVEYQPRNVSLDNMSALRQTLDKEVSIFEEDYLELKEQEKVLRYRAALISEGRESGVYSPQARGHIFNIVTRNIGGIDMSKDKIEVSGVVGPVNIKSQLDRVTQIVKNAPAMPDDKKQEFAQLVADLHQALVSASENRPDESERVARTAELVATEVAKEKPDREFLNITVEGLKQAAKAIEDIAPAAIRVAAKVAMFVSGL
jgi:hypothetical protein